MSPSGENGRRQILQPVRQQVSGLLYAPFHKSIQKTFSPQNPFLRTRFPCGRFFSFPLRSQSNATLWEATIAARGISSRSGAFLHKLFIDPIRVKNIFFLLDISITMGWHDPNSLIGTWDQHGGATHRTCMLTVNALYECKNQASGSQHTHRPTDLDTRIAQLRTVHL